MMDKKRKMQEEIKLKLVGGIASATPKSRMPRSRYALKSDKPF
jgi:hypothetical protein